MRLNQTLYCLFVFFGCGKEPEVRLVISYWICAYSLNGVAANAIDSNWNGRRVVTLL